MSLVALQNFNSGKYNFSAGEVLPPRARNWAHLRELQRKGLVSGGRPGMTISAEPPSSTSAQIASTAPERSEVIARSGPGKPSQAGAERRESAQAPKSAAPEFTFEGFDSLGTEKPRSPKASAAATKRRRRSRKKG